jgi:hypothetical protein
MTPNKQKWMCVAGCGSNGEYAIELTTSDWQAKLNITIFFESVIGNVKPNHLLLE